VNAINSTVTPKFEEAMAPPRKCDYLAVIPKSWVGETSSAWPKGTGQQLRPPGTTKCVRTAWAF